jgi:XrtJ-associated TM-motif-TM protein
MKKRFAFLLPILFLVARTMFGQGGCVDSPEAPTYVLGIIGGVSVALVLWDRRSTPKR